MKFDNIPNEDVKEMKTEIAREFGVSDFEEIDRGELTSRENGDITRTLVALAEESMAGKQHAAVPGTVVNQNLGHNAKKEGFGPNIKR